MADRSIRIAFNFPSKKIMKSPKEWPPMGKNGCSQYVKWVKYVIVSSMHSLKWFKVSHVNTF